jgi:hypothetical protein
MVEQLKLGGLYQHYKGKNYIVRDLVRHSETLEWMVFYECLYENPAGKLWVRPMAMFLETVEIEGKTIPRFRYIGDQKGKEGSRP